MNTVKVVQKRVSSSSFWVRVSSEPETWATINLIPGNGLTVAVAVKQGEKSLIWWTGPGNMMATWGKLEEFLRSRFQVRLRYSTFQHAWERCVRHLEGAGGRSERADRANLDKTFRDRLQ